METLQNLDDYPKPYVCHAELGAMACTYTDCNECAENVAQPTESEIIDD